MSSFTTRTPQSPCQLQIQAALDEVDGHIGPLCCLRKSVDVALGAGAQTKAVGCIGCQIEAEVGEGLGALRHAGQDHFAQEVLLTDHAEDSGQVGVLAEVHAIREEAVDGNDHLQIRVFVIHGIADVVGVDLIRRSLAAVLSCDDLHDVQAAGREAHSDHDIGLADVLSGRSVVTDVKKAGAALAIAPAATAVAAVAFKNSLRFIRISPSTGRIPPVSPVRLIPACSVYKAGCPAKFLMQRHKPAHMLSKSYHFSRDCQ